MKGYDFAPLWRSTIGFDRVFDLINDNSRLSSSDYPPYDITRTSEDAYRISLAIAGFSPEEITITAQQNLLKVAGQKAELREVQYLHQGIAARPFERQFSLEDHVEVEGAAYENGQLQIDLRRRVPEAMKPRKIAIATGKLQNSAKTVEHRRAAS